jgi:hypothetical protein
MQMAFTYANDSDFENTLQMLQVVAGPIDDDDDPVCHVIEEGRSSDFDRFEFRNLLRFRSAERSPRHRTDGTRT